MSVTELDEVQALLERVLPDPTGFAQRLLLQAMTRFGQSAAAGGTPMTASATVEDVTASDTVMPAGQYGWDQAPVDTNLLLAAALGACECWGLQASCGLCQGMGSSGWTQPDPELFREFVQPAVTRLSRDTGADGVPDGHKHPDHDSHDHPTAQGAKHERSSNGSNGRGAVRKRASVRT